MDSIFVENFGKANNPQRAEAEGIHEWSPPVDILESDDQWRFVVDLPGVREEDIHVDVLESRLRIAGTRRAAPPQPHGWKSLHVERSYGPFSRTFQLPPDSRSEDIGAKLSRGVLTVTIPKGNASSQSRRVSIAPK